MIIIGVDYHPSDQYIAFANVGPAECGERRLNHIARPCALNSFFFQRYPSFMANACS